MSRKGDVGPAESISTFIGGMILIGMFVIFIVFVANYFTDFGVMMQISSNQLNTIDLSYMAQDCLREEGEYYIRADILDKLQLEYAMNEFNQLGATTNPTMSFMRQKCSILIEDGGIMVTNMETGKVWNFGYSGADKFRHGIFINIREGDEIYVGQLNASIGA